MSRKKILEVIQPTDGGSALHVKQLLAKIDKSRFELHLAAQPDADYIALCKQFSIPFYPIPFRHSANPLHDLRPFLELGRICRDSSIEVVHLHSTKAGLVGRFAAKLHGKKVIYTPHSPLYLQPQSKMSRAMFYWAEKLTMPLVDTVVLVSQSEYARVIDDSLCSQAKCKVIVNGLDVGKPKAANAGSPVITMVSRLEKQKRQQDLIMAAPLVINKFPTAQIRLIGNGSRYDELAALITKLGMDKHVKMLGQRADVPQQFQQSTVVVQCSETEGLPYVLLEAMAQSRPIVGTRVEGIVDLVKDRHTGSLYELGDYEGLATNICYLLSHPEKAQQFGQNGYWLIEKEYSLKNMLANIESLYEAA